MLASAPSPSSVAISRRLISRKTSSHVKIASSSGAGASATAHLAISSPPMVRLENLQRCEPFGPSFAAAREPARGAYREGHRQPQRDGEVEVDLHAEGLVGLRSADRVIDRQHAAEQGGARRAQVEARRTDLGEAQRRQIPFGHRLSELPAVDLVDLEAREAFIVAVSLHFTVIDVIVAEGSEIIAAERARPLPAGDARRAVEPD